MDAGTFDYRGLYPGMVTLSDGAMMPAKMAAHGDHGWGTDEDRDSTQVARLAELVRDMDASVSAWLADSAATEEEAERIMGLWLDIRRIMRGAE